MIQRYIRTTFYILFIFKASIAPSIETNSEGNRAKKIEHFTLSNGMEVVLKHTEFDEDEVLFRFSALGGYAALPEKKKASAQLSSEIAWESGVGEMNADRLNAVLYENSIDFNPEVHPFYREIEGSSDRNGVEPFLQITNLFFTQPRFTKTAFEQIREETKNSISKRPNDREMKFEEEFKAIITGNSPSFTPLTLADLNLLDFNVSKECFEKFFGNPGDFICVIVGNFDESHVRPLITKYLESIPSKKTTAEPPPSPLKLPTSVTHEKIKGYNSNKSIVRITFPLKIAVNEQDLAALEFACQVMETKIRRLFRKEYDETMGIDVAYEFPLYPYRESSWILMQFHSNPKQEDAMIRSLISALSELQSKGPTADELALATDQLDNNEEFWKSQNIFWISALSNYALWNWSLDNILTNYSKYSIENRKKIDFIINDGISLGNYIIIKSR